MTTLDLALIAAIDARIKAGERDVFAFGTVMSVDSDNDMTITFDGSAASIPCKTFGNVFALAGDRVGLAKIGAWWTVIGTFARHWLSDYGAQATQSSGTTTSASYGDIPVQVSCTFPKLFDTTDVKFAVAGACFSATSGGTIAEYGVNISSPSHAAQDISVTLFTINPTSQHQSASNWIYVAGLAADTYTVKVRWRRVSGAGTLTMDTGDIVCLSVQEVTPQ